MRIEITKRIDQVSEIDIDLPYYYKHDLYSDHGDSVIYGKISETECTTIHEKIYHDDVEYSIQVEKHQSIKNSGLSSYFEVNHKSSDIEFEAVTKRMLVFFQDNLLKK